MARLRQRTLALIFAFLLILSSMTVDVQASSWNTGLDMVVVLAAASHEDALALSAPLNRLLALATTRDRITILTGPSDDQRVTLEERRTMDEQSLSDFLGRQAEADDPVSVERMLISTAAYLAEAGRADLQPLLLFLDSGDPRSAEDTPELTDLLNWLARQNCLVASLSLGTGGEIVRVIEEYGGLAFTPEDEAAEHRALISLLAQARSCPRLPVVDGYLPVDESCQQISLLLVGQGDLPMVTRPNGSVLDLDQKEVVWTQDSSGATVTITDPEPGYWRILGEGWSGEAIITSTLRLGHLPVLPVYAVGEPLTLLAYLANGDRLSPDPLPYSLSVKADLLGPSQATDSIIFYDDGQHGDGAARDGLYGAQIQLNIPGPYQLSYRIERGLLVREQAVSFKVEEPDGQERHYTLSPELIDLPRLVPGRAYQQTITLTSHLPKAERFRFQIGDDHTDLRSFGELVISPDEIELQPGESRTMTLDVRLQPKATLGGYAGHLRLVPVSQTQRGQIVPLRLGLVPWPIAHWPWLAAGGVGLFAAMLTASMVLSRPQLRGWLSNEALGGRERVHLHGYHFLPSPTSHQTHLMAVRSAGYIRVHLCVDRHDPPVLLNGVPASGRIPLNDGDQLRLGRTIWEFREEQDEAAATKP